MLLGQMLKFKSFDTACQEETLNLSFVINILSLAAQKIYMPVEPLGSICL